MTQREHAQKGDITDEMRTVAEREHIALQTLVARIAEGEIALVKNANRTVMPLAVGKGLSTKVNANIGTSPDASDVTYEIEKMHAAIHAGADAIMDLSTGGNLDVVRERIIAEATVPLGTVPLYQIAHDVMRDGKKTAEMTIQDVMTVIERQAEQGVDFMTIHSGVTKESVAHYRKNPRLTGIVSRGGAILLEWIAVNKKENPLYEHYDEILDILHAYDVTISIGDGMRPGSLADATDRTQVAELLLLGELAERALAKGVQVMIEGPGHVPLHEIEANIMLQKKLCRNTPFYVLGPLVTDIAPGYDHITGAIGGALAAKAGADFLCYVTPAEHLRLPTVEDVHEGVMAFRIAAHAGDISKGVPHALDRDIAISERRKALDWEGQFNLALDKEKCVAYRKEFLARELEECTMCGEFCSMKKDTAVANAAKENA